MVELNDLYDYGLKIYQNSENFKFSLDSILLAESVDLKKESKIMDFCTGNASIPLILSTKGYNNIYGIEIQTDVYNIALKTLSYNKLNEYISIINDNLNNVSNYFPGNNFDAVICNPPYFKVTDKSLLNDNEMKAMSRHEISTDLDKILFNANYILKDKGYFFIVYRTDRFQELNVSLKKHSFFVKKMYLIKTNSKQVDLVILKCIKNGKYGSTCILTDVSNVFTYKGIFE